MKQLQEEIAFDYAAETQADPTYTHSLHPFPAKFPPQLPRSILAKFARRGDTVLDPFCGSGTTLVEARLGGIHSVGVDINGLACLISKVKSTPLSTQQLKRVRDFIDAVTEESQRWQMGKRIQVEVPEIEGLNHWFQDNVALELSLILQKIDLLKDKDVSDFMRAAFSSIVVRVSNQDSDTRFAAIDKQIPDGFTLDLFVTRSKECVKQMQEFSGAIKYFATVQTHNADSRKLDFLETESVDLIVTSPPYANTYDYYLYHKFRKRWLGIDVQFAQLNEIGSRREYSSLKENPKKWALDLELCFSEMARVLKQGGMMVLVLGDSVIRGRLLKMDRITAGMASKLGLKVDQISSTSLTNHSKVFNPAFTNRRKKEHLILLRKVRNR